MPQNQIPRNPFQLIFIKTIVVMVDYLSSGPRNCAIFSLSYSLLLRHDKVSHLLCSHIMKVKGGLSFFNPSSKTDVHRSGKSLILAREDSPVSVYSLLLSNLCFANLELDIDHFLFGPISFNKTSVSTFIENRSLSYTTFTEKS